MSKFQPLPPRQQKFFEGEGDTMSRQWYQWFLLVQNFFSLLGGLPAPTSSTGAGTPGQYAYDANFLYLCIATNSWKRIPLLAF